MELREKLTMGRENRATGATSVIIYSKNNRWIKIVQDHILYSL